MQDTRSDLFPDTRRAGDEDAAARPRHAFQRCADIVDRGAIAGQLFGRAGLFAQLLIFEFQPFILGSARHKVQQSRCFERLFDKIERPAADRRDRGVEPSVTRDDDDRQRRVERLDCLDQSQPVEARALQPHVDERERRAPLADRFERRVAVERGPRFVTLVLHDPGHEVADVALIVDNQNIKRHDLLCPAGFGCAPGPFRSGRRQFRRPALPAAAADRDAASA
jgi:hypothetical protein